MHRFFVDDHGVIKGRAMLERQDAQHALRVLRLKAGDEMELLDGQKRYAAVIERVEGDNVCARVISECPCTEPNARITLFQGLPKAEKMEFIVQKCTELGVYDIQPVQMERCVAQVKEKDAEKKRERWQKIAREAAKQCGRARVPKIHAPVAIEALEEAWNALDLLLVPWEEARGGGIRAALASSPKEAARIGIMIGPEGGISPAEAHALDAAGGRLVTLGPRILRTETAGMAALTLTLGFLGEME